MMKHYKPNLKFVEPQSMNFEKKLSEAYIEFKQTMEKRAKREAEAKEKEKEQEKEKEANEKIAKDKEKHDVHELKRAKTKQIKELDHLPIAENNFEDLLFQVSLASAKIQK